MVILNCHFEGLEHEPGNSYGLNILDYPINHNILNPCADLGDIFDPYGIFNYTERCQANHTHCAVGDLTTRHVGFNS